MAARRIWILGWIFDIFTVTLSVTDVVTDVLVLIEMQRLGYGTLFCISLSILALSQISYTGMFVSLFATDVSVPKKVIIFLLVLPLAQLVPIFTWLESLHFAPVDRALERLGLEVSEGPKKSDGNDKSFKEAIEGKLKSHSGFIMEAFVEAIPQAALTTIFIVVLGHASVASIVSVAISIITIASKTYLLAFALDSVTFCSNFLCTIGDCFGLFATVTVLAQEGTHDWLTWVLVGLAVLGAGALASGLLLLFAHNTADDHLKTRHPSHWQDKVNGISYVCFDVYFVHLWTATLLIVPCTVALLSIRLSIMPLIIRAAFASKVDDDTSHMRFFRKLIRFIRQGSDVRRGCFLWPSAHLRQRVSEERRARLWRVNNLIEYAQKHRKLVPNSESQSSVRDWVEKASCPPVPPAVPYPSAKRDRHMNITVTTQKTSFQQLLLLCWHTFTKWLTEDEECCRKGRNQLAELRREFRTRPINAFLWSISWLTLVCFPLCCVVCFLSFICLVPVNIAFPMIHAYPTCQEFAAGEVTAMLPCFLCSAHLTAITCVLLLAPIVAHRQLDWLGLKGTHNLRRAFYSELVVAELSRRHLCEAMLQRHLGRNLTHYTFSFLQMPSKEEAKAPPEVLGKPRAQTATAWE